MDENPIGGPNFGLKQEEQHNYGFVGDPTLFYSDLLVLFGGGKMVVKMLEWCSWIENKWQVWGGALGWS